MVGDGDEMAFPVDHRHGAGRCGGGRHGDDEDNLVACQLAKRKFNVPKTVRSGQHPANVRIFKTLGVDVALSAPRSYST